MKTDVFISYSRKDYLDKSGDIIQNSPIKIILEFLDANQISYWFDKEGIQEGAKFIKVITDAISNAKMIIFISSCNSNLSVYTAGEIKEAVDSKKLIIPVRLDKSEYNSSFRLLINNNSHIDFNNKDALQLLLKSIMTEKNRIAIKEEEEKLQMEELKKKEHFKNLTDEIIDLASQLRIKQESCDKLLSAINNKLLEIGITHKQCPVCESQILVEADYCYKCGWHFPWLSSIKLDGLNLEIDMPLLNLHRDRWNSENNVRYEANDNSGFIKRDDIICEEEIVTTNDSHDLEKIETSINYWNKLSSIFNDKSRLIWIGDCCLDMIFVEGGTFKMGATIEQGSDARGDEYPAHNVTLDSYLIGRIVVTQYLWGRFMNVNPSHKLGQSFPVTNVSWVDCQEFICKLNAALPEKLISEYGYFRLPTEAEWEYAARCGMEHSSYNYRYSGSNVLDEVSANIGNSHYSISHAGCFKPNALGIYDMSGNVFEWCADKAAAYSTKAQYNPFQEGWMYSVSCRGGSYMSDPSFCRVSCRCAHNKSAKFDDLGFRLVLSKITF